MKKAIGQTVRDLKREVNKKVLKVPTVEQKVLDATSNEPWGPHGTLLADIAHATRNYHEYQLIMSVIWKRINDTGKNWRHVYKALTVLEYLVGHGSERVIDEIREHAYQIQTLSDFQYIDSSGRDQGSNVRKKSQSLVVLVNDKERIQEVRQKAAANRDKFRNAPAGGMYKPGPGGYGDRYDDDRYGSRDDERNGYGRDREYGYRDDDRYGRYGDSYGRDGDRFGREHEDRYGRDDDYSGRSRSVDEQYSSRSRSSDRERDRTYEDDGQYSSRGSGARADEQSQDGSVAGRRDDGKYSEQNLGAPPSYEEAVGGSEAGNAAQSPSHSERDGVTSAASPKPSSPPATSSPTQATSTAAPAPEPTLAPAPTSPASAAVINEADGFDEFDPRGSFPPAPATSSGATHTTSVGGDMDLLGSLSDSFMDNSLALVPTSSVTSTNQVDAGSVPTYTSASSAPNQGFDDPFGDGPFKAIPSTDGVQGQQQSFNSVPSFQIDSNQGPELPQQASQSAAVGTFPGATSMPSGSSNLQLPSTDTQYSQQEFSAPDHNIDILADILPPTGPQPPVNLQPGYPETVNQTVPQMGYNLPQTGQNMSQTNFSSQSGSPAYQTGFPAQFGQPTSLTNQSVQQSGFLPQNGQNVSQTTFSSQSDPAAHQTGFQAQSGQPTSMTGGFPAQSGQLVVHPNFPSQYGQPSPQAGFPAHNGQSPSFTNHPNQAAQASQTGYSGFTSQVNPLLHAGFQSHPSGQSAQPNAVSYENYNMQSGSVAPVGHMVPQGSAGATSPYNTTNNPAQSSSQVASQSPFSSGQGGSPLAPPLGFSSTGSISIAPTAKEKFETKSTVWADTLSRGLVNLNISGPKTNPLSDIGVDFDSLNRKDKRMEKPAATPVTSTIHMGKAMGSGTGIGRAGAGALRPAPSPMMGSNIGMGMGGPRPGVGMGGYGGMNQQPMGVGMGLNMQPNMGMGMNMGIGGQMQQPAGFPPGSTLPGGYNPMMGQGNYGQNPYGGGGYR